MQNNEQNRNFNQTPWQMCTHTLKRLRTKGVAGVAFGIFLLLTACTPTPESNVVGYFLARRLGTLTMQPETTAGTITGTVVNSEGDPIEGATVVVATRTGTPYAAR